MRASAYIAITLGIVVTGVAVYVEFAPQNKPPKALPVVDPAAAKESPERLFARGGRAAMDAMLEQYKTAIAGSPDDWPRYVSLGKALLLLDQQQDAETILRLGYQRTKANPQVNVKDAVTLKAVLASALIARGEHQESAKLLDEALTANPRDGEANWAMAKLLGQQAGGSDYANLGFIGRAWFRPTRIFAAANEHYDFASMMLPDSADVLCDWGILLLTQDREMEAETRFRQAIRMEKQGAKYYFWLGQALRKQARFGPAIQAERTAHELSPKLAEPCIELGAIYAQIHEYREAESYYRAALSAEPTSAAAMEGLSRVLIGTPDMAQRNYLEAAMLLKSAADLSRGKDLNLELQAAGAYALAKVWPPAVDAMDLAIALAKNQNTPPGTLELLMSTRQEYLHQQLEMERKEEGVETTVTIGGEGMVQGANPFDAPAPSKPIEVRVFGPADARLRPNGQGTP